MDCSRSDLLKQAEDELYSGLQAICVGDLPWARAASARANRLIIDAWQVDLPVKKKVDPKS